MCLFLNYPIARLCVMVHHKMAEFMGGIETASRDVLFIGRKYDHRALREVARKGIDIPRLREQSRYKDSARLQQAHHVRYRTRINRPGVPNSLRRQLNL